MTHNQEQLQQNIRAITGTELTYNEDWVALFDAASILEGSFNDRMVAYLQSVLDSSLSNLNELKALYANRQGLDRWEDVINIIPSMLSSNVMWLAANGNISTTGALVDTWEDMSGNGNDATSSGASRPTLTQDAINGLPALTFSGSQNMDGASALYTLPTGNYTTYEVVQRDSESGSSEAIWGMGVGAANRVFNTFTATIGRAAFQNRTTFNQVEIDGETLTDYNIVKCQVASTIQAIEFNGGTDSTENVAQSVAGVDSFKIGALGTGSSPLTGTIAEFLMFNESLSATNQTLILNYLSQKHNIALV